MKRRTASLLAWLLFGVSLAVSIAAVVLGTLPTRQPLEIEALGYGLAIMAFPVAGALIVSRQPGNLIGWPGNILIGVGLLTLPISVGVAILKYRLYDVDLLINRTLVYGLLTALLIGFYVAATVGLGAGARTLTGQENNSLVIAASTLAVAALFGPARRRIQAFIDRRFYRQKYNAARTMEFFSARLREQVDLDSLASELVGVVRDTMQPAHVSLWLPEGPPASGRTL